MKYLVHYVRIEHQVYRLEVEADSKQEAEDIAEQEFTGSENYDVVHAEEFINQVDELEDKHHPLCTAHDGIGCRCEELEKTDLKSRAEEFLEDYHVNELGRLLGLSEDDGRKIARQIYFEWGFDRVDDWQAVKFDDTNFILQTIQNGIEWIDESGNHRIFESSESAYAHLRRSLDLHHKNISELTYS